MNRSEVAVRTNGPAQLLIGRLVVGVAEVDQPRSRLLADYQIDHEAES